MEQSLISERFEATCIIKFDAPEIHISCFNDTCFNDDDNDSFIYVANLSI